VQNTPLEPATWRALESLCAYILDPVIDTLGPVKVTYGFSGPDLVRAVRREASRAGRPPRIAPHLDQHAGHEVTDHGRVCARPGIAIDFEVPGVSADVVAAWLLRHAPVDRLYLYASDRPLHVSWAPQATGVAYQMQGIHRVPRPWKPTC
jgi:hypothetical protein